MRKFLTSAVVVALMAFCAASSASAAEYTVDSVGDQVDSAVGSNSCRTALDTCTLRAAIEESNGSVGVTDTIRFDFSTFDGQIGDTIELGSSLPTITDSAKVGGLPFLPCETGYFGVSGPCVGIDGPAGGTAIRVSAKEVVLNSLAFSGAKTGIKAVGGFAMRLYNDWFGLKLDGSGGPLETGVFLDQDSDSVTVGSVGSEARDIFANSGVGLVVDGADGSDIRGNGFGVMPDGATPAPNETNIEVTDADTGDNRVARGTWIGETLGAKALESPICDGGCNVIAAAAGAGIDLAGGGADGRPASGSTRIFGNYIGVDAFGTASAANDGAGVNVGSAENVTIGGPRPGDRNLITGGAYGVLAGPNAGNLLIEGDWIGLDATGTKVLDAPTTAGVAVEGGYQTGVSGNRISMASGTAVEIAGGEAVIRFNEIGKAVDGEDLPGASIGVHLKGSCFECGFVYGNSIANASHQGVLIEGSRNRLYGNRIEGAGEAGVQVREPGLFGRIITRNVIGGDSGAEENVISENEGAAIEINHVTDFGLNTENEVARNRGGLNGGPFIELLGGANGGIEPPVFLSSTPSGATGSALPGARVRVFQKATSSAGELAGFLCEAVADAGGNWSVSYPAPIAAGTYVAATQTSLIEGTATPEPADGTSELAISQTTQGDESQGGGSQLPAPPAPPNVGVPPIVVPLGKAIPWLPILDRFARSELPLANGRWTRTRWTDEIGSSWQDPWHGFGATLSHRAGAFWNKATFRDSGGPIVAAATLGSPPNYERWPNEYLSLWIDMPNPSKVRSGYEVRFRGAKRKPNAYTVELSRWIGGHRKILKKRRKVSLPVNTNFALSETAGNLVVWTGTSTVEPIMVATDHTYSGGYVGIEANRGEGTAYDFRAGNVIGEVSR